MVTYHSGVRELRAGELVTLDVDDLELNAERPPIYLSSDKQKGRPGDVYSATDTLKQYLAGR